jgi:hypothetical protein
MIPSRFDDQPHYNWMHLVDYETLWMLAFSAVVIGSGIFALTSIAP